MREDQVEHVLPLLGSPPPLCSVLGPSRHSAVALHGHLCPLLPAACPSAAAGTRLACETCLPELSSEPSVGSSVSELQPWISVWCPDEL